MQVLRNGHSGDLGLKAVLPPFLLGFLATALQIYLLREFAANFYGNELTYGLVLGAWLLWGGLGSLRGRSPRRPAEVLPWLYSATLLLGMASFILLRLSHRLLGILPGELTGVGPALLFSLALGLLVSLPLGWGFVLNAALAGGNAPRVYVLESFGAASAGLAVHFLLIPRLSNWEGVALVSGTAAAAVFLLRGPRKRAVSIAVLGASLAAAAAFARLDVPLQRAAWRPFDMVAAEDTPYGKLQVVKSGTQFTLYSDGLRFLTAPDPGAAEESVHLALLQRPSSGRILLIGGGAGGSVEEVLKYPSVVVDYVELDPAVIRLAEKFLPPEGLAALRSPRVTTYLQDGRSFVQTAPRSYDAILVSLPEPATAQLNRFYTKEFFQAARAHLRPGGILGFAVPAAESYVGRDLAMLLGTLRATLALVFPEVLVVPGDNAVFVASEAPLTADPERLADVMTAAGLSTRYVTPETLRLRLSPRRVSYLAGRMAAAPAGINRDLVPVSYYFHSVLWAAQFRGAEAAVLRLFTRIPARWILAFPIAAVLAVMAFYALGRRGSPSRLLVPVGLVGLTSILVEIAVIVAFQSFYGYVYGKIALLLALFMAGLGSGGLLGLRSGHPGKTGLVAAAGGSTALLVLLGLFLTWGGPEVFPFLFLFAFGALAGWLFVLANRIYLSESPRPGTAYGVDLLASFLGVILASAFIIPLAGVPELVAGLALLNGAGFLYVLTPAGRAVPQGQGTPRSREARNF